jgi:nuclear protein localization protein 4 homolog
MEQRMAWLYGYYSEDPNYPEGVRVNIEALYEPPQIGEINGVQALDDPNMAKIDMVAEALSLEKVGWIFTSINQDTFLTSQEIRKVAQL